MFILKDDIDKIKLRNIKLVFNVSEFNRELLTEGGGEFDHLNGDWYMLTTVNE